MTKSYSDLNRKFKRFTGGFSLVELMVVIVIIGILTGVSFIGVSQVKRKAANEKMLDDLLFIANALEDYRRDNQGNLPIPSPKKSPVNQNILCFYKDATYAHDCDQAEFIQGMVDQELLGTRYLRQVPTDPRTGARYTYGVSKDKQYFQVAGVFDGGGKYEARMAGNLEKGYPLPSIIRAYNGPNFVVNGEEDLPYSPDHLSLTGTLQAVNGNVEVDGFQQTDGFLVQSGNKIATNNGKADIYFSDGSITQLEKNTEIILGKMEIPQNNDKTIASILNIELKAGKIWNKVTRLAGGSEFNVEATGSIAGVRGTEFGIEIKGGSKEIQVLSGEVVVSADKNSSKPPLRLTAAKKTTVSGTSNSGSQDMSPADVEAVINAHYLDLPLHSGIEPYVMEVKGDAQTSKANIRVRNVNHYVNLVNDQTFATTQQGPVKRSRSKVIAHRLAVYDDNGTLVVSKDIQNQPKAAYDISLPLAQAKSLKLRFEECDSMPACNTVVRSSAYSRAKLDVDSKTDLKDENLYPNLFKANNAGLKLVLNAPNIVTEKNPFTIGGVLDGTLAPASVTSIGLTLNGNNSCTLPANNPTAAPQFSATITTSGAGNCDIVVTVELDDKRVFKESIYVQIVKQGQLLFLKQPAPKAVLDKTRVTLIWEAPNAPKGSSYKVQVVDQATKGTVFNETSPTLGQSTTSYTTTKLFTPSANGTDYEWTVELVDPSNKVIDSQSSTFVIKKALTLNFKVDDVRNQKTLTFNNDEATVETPAQKLRFDIEIQNAPSSGVDYEWTGSTPAVTKTSNTKGFFEIEASQLTQPNTTVFVKLNLTARDGNKNIVGSTIKRVNVIHVPAISLVQFDKPLKVTAGQKVALSSAKILMNVQQSQGGIGGTGPLGLGGSNNNQIGNQQLATTPLLRKDITADKCPNLSVKGSAGKINNGFFEASNTSNKVTEKILCTIKPGEKIDGFMVYSTQAIVAELTVEISPGQTPLQILQNKCSTLNTNGTKTTFKNNGCWLMANESPQIGAAGESCAAACTRVGLTCTDVNTGGQDWNDDTNCSICTSLNQVTNCTAHNSQSTLGASPYNVVGQACRYRGSSTANCTDPSPTLTRYKTSRLCRCE